ncbi:MAG: OmpA family protein [Alphaproteobacteria bacterium]|nr:OmpA family protein [Alphaproteobacteria bacterium]
MSMRLTLAAAAGAAFLAAAPSHAQAPAFKEQDCKPPIQGQGNYPGPYVFNYDTGKSDVTAEHKKVLADVAKNAKGYYVTRICLLGRADKQGNKASNEALAKKRAENLKAELVKLGVKASTMQTLAVGEGYGDAIPGFKSQQDRVVQVLLVK